MKGDGDEDRKAKGTNSHQQFSLVVNFKHLKKENQTN